MTDRAPAETKPLPRAELARAAVVWHVAAKIAGEPAIADALLDLARVALDAHLAAVRAQRRRLLP